MQRPRAAWEIASPLCCRGSIPAGASAVAGGLQFEQFGVAPAPRLKFLVRSGLDDLAPVEDEDAVGHAHGGKAVRDQHAAAATAEIAKALEHLELGAGVEGGRGLVEDQDLGLAHIGPAERDLLPLAAGEVDAVGEALAERLVVAQRQAFDHAVGEAAPGGAGDAGGVLTLVDAPDGDVLRGGEIEAHEILEDHADSGAQVVEVVIGERPAIE